MKFARPEILWLLWALPLLVGLLVWWRRRAGRMLAGFVAPALAGRMATSVASSKA